MDAVSGHTLLLLCASSVVFLVETKACKYHCFFCVQNYSIQIYRANACEYFCEVMRLTCQLLFFKTITIGI